jgi:hypothetical protein
VNCRIYYHQLSKCNTFEIFMDSQSFGIRFLFTAIGVITEVIRIHLFRGTSLCPIPWVIHSDHQLLRHPYPRTLCPPLCVSCSSEPLYPFGSIYPPHFRLFSISRLWPLPLFSYSSLRLTLLPSHRRPPKHSLLPWHNPSRLHSLNLP